MKSIGRANNPTPPKITKRNIPTKVMVAMRKITKLTSIESSISLQVYEAFDEALAIGEVEDVNVLMFLLHAVTGMSAVDQNVYRINTTMQITTNVQPDS